MQVEIDQSGKIETTSRQTVIGLASRDGRITKTLLIRSRDKKKIQQTFRAAGQPATFVLKTFAAAIVLLLNEVNQPTTVVIDTEYPGHEAHIRQSILHLAAKLRLKLDRDQIVFQPIGKTSPAHGVAIRAYRTKKADTMLSAQTILALLLQ